MSLIHYRFRLAIFFFRRSDRSKSQKHLEMLGKCLCWKTSVDRDARLPDTSMMESFATIANGF